MRQSKSQHARTRYTQDKRKLPVHGNTELEQQDTKADNKTKTIKTKNTKKVKTKRRELDAQSCSEKKKEIDTDGHTNQRNVHIDIRCGSRDRRAINDGYTLALIDPIAHNAHTHRHS
ncbi:hypothetical protein GCM10020218_034590 [Dactylosporangium vinaceum]